MAETLEESADRIAYHKKVHAWDRDTVSVELPGGYHPTYAVVEIRRAFESEPHTIFVSGDDTAEALENAFASIKEAMRAQQIQDLYAEGALSA